MKSFGIGRFTTEAEVDYTIEKTVEHVKRLREMRFDIFLTNFIYFSNFFVFNLVHYGKWFKRELIYELLNGLNINILLVFFPMHVYIYIC